MVFASLRRLDNNTSLTPYGALLLRLTLAALWLIHGLYKVVHDGMPATEQFFVGLGYPGWVAWVDIIIECGAFVVLLLGTYVRLFSILLLALLIPATLVWIPKGFFFINGGYEFPLVWCVLQIVQALLGPGAWNMSAIRQATEVPGQSARSVLSPIREGEEQRSPGNPLLPITRAKTS